MVHYRSGRPYIDTTAYPDMDGFWSDLSAAYAREIEQLHELGCTYLQMDDTCFAYLNDANQRREIDERGEDGADLHLRYIKQINEAVAGRPDDLTLTVHMCRGNFRSSWVAEGGYDYVAEPLLSELDVDGYFMEFDDDRSGGFEPLRFVPKDKFIVLGLVTSKRPELESKDEIKRRLEAASKYVPLEQLCLSPQCGFSSTVEGNSLTVEEEKAKLRLVVEVADEVWG
jgi:5-methyltetrahydropteroyltriglutamate--homocysteine methyltransferase